jgi:predicted metal-dependent phosphoesterase TrpH
MQNAHAINADLHCHSTVSDGLLSPSDVARGRTPAASRSGR